MNPKKVLDDFEFEDFKRYLTSEQKRFDGVLWKSIQAVDLLREENAKLKEENNELRRQINGFKEYAQAILEK